MLRQPAGFVSSFALGWLQEALLPAQVHTAPMLVETCCNAVKTGA